MSTSLADSPTKQQRSWFVSKLVDMFGGGNAGAPERSAPSRKLMAAIRKQKGPPKPVRARPGIAPKSAGTARTKHNSLFSRIGSSTGPAAPTPASQDLFSRIVANDVASDTNELAPYVSTIKTKSVSLAKLRRRFADKMEAIIDKNLTTYEGYDRVVVDSVCYAVLARGDLLAPVSPWDAMSISKTFHWNNHDYHMKASGNLVRQGRDTTMPAPYCVHFTSKGTYYDPTLLTPGFCSRGKDCKFLHDPERIRICRRIFSPKGCVRKSCLLSHTLNQFNTPICSFHLAGACTNAACKFIRRDASDFGDNEVWVCRPFAVKGYCERGLVCPFYHMWLCPDYEETGQCAHGAACGLTHAMARSTRDRLMKNIADQNDTDVLIEDDGPHVVNSYTVDPAALFVSPDGHYQVDNPKGTSEFTIDLASSDEEMEKPE